METIIKNFNTALGKVTLNKLLGKGKSGYSYLSEYGEKCYILKIMHEEPCQYYTFGKNKVESEVSAYHRLNDMGIRIPQLLDYNIKRNYLLKEYIEGPTAAKWIIEGGDVNLIMPELFRLAFEANRHGLNIDYFPTNFVISDPNLFYIDYEINPFDQTWSLENWGLFYWVNVAGMKEYFNTGNALSINISPESGMPIKEAFQKQVNRLIEKYCIS
jgi:predicted Ser/Thr protein kinase